MLLFNTDMFCVALAVNISSKIFASSVDDDATCTSLESMHTYML